MTEKYIPKAKQESITKLEDLGTLAKRIYRAGVNLAMEANKIRKSVRGSLSNDRGLSINSNERSFIKKIFEKKGWSIKITSKVTPPNDIQMTEGQSSVELSIKRVDKKKK